MLGVPSTQRSPMLLLLLLAMAAALTLWALLSAGMHPAVDQDIEGASPGTHEVGERVPGLKTQEGPRPAPEALADEGLVADDDWTIEVTSVLTAEGKPATGASVFLDRRSGSDSFTWRGRPLRIHLRKPTPGALVPQQREDMLPYVSGEEVYLSVHHDGHARWFAPALLPAGGRVSSVRATLAPARALRGSVRRHDGKGPPEHASELAVALTLPGVPASIYTELAPLDAEGRFAFAADAAIPTTPVVLEARSDQPGIDGCVVTREVEADEQEVLLLLRRPHRFEVLVSFAERDESARLGQRDVYIHRPGAERERLFRYPVTTSPTKPARELQQTVFVLPEGPPESWRLSVPGYLPAIVEVHPSGPDLDHVRHVRFEPDPQSAIVELRVRLPEGHTTGTVSLRADGKGEDPMRTQWRVRWDLGRSPRRLAVRLPSGDTRVARLSANLREEDPKAPWVMAPLSIGLVPGQRMEHEARIVRGGVAIITRKRIGGFMPELHVRLTRGVARHDLHRWFTGVDEKKRHAYCVIEALEPGRWRVELVHAGRVLPWSGTFDVELGKLIYVTLPDLASMVPLGKKQGG